MYHFIVNPSSGSGSGAVLWKQIEKKLLEEQGVGHVLEWNEGNHFRDPERRCARGFAWCLRTLRR